jgi:hypothetical protein
MALWSITTLDKAPAMTHTRRVIEVETYKEAVEETRKSWQETRQATALYDGKLGQHAWYVISGRGEEKDRNLNGM